MIKAIIFDWDGVFTTGFYDKILNFCPDHKLLEEIETKYSSQIDCSGFFEEIRSRFKTNLTNKKIIELFNHEIMTGLMDYLPELKKNHKIFLLSNQMTIRTDYIKENFDLEIFDELFFSNEIGLIKPSKEIYNFVLKKINCNADECIFIDDNQKNIEAARNIGINTIRFFNIQKLADDIRKFGIII